MTTVSLRVRDCMTRELVMVPPDADLTRVVHTMVDADVSALLVVESGDRLVGIVTERDCIAAAPAADYYGDWGGPVSKFMSVPVETVGPDDDLVEVAVMMAGSRYRNFPVVEHGRVVGLMSRRDLLKVLDRGAGLKRPG